MIVPPLGRSPRLAFRAAGFMATSTVGASPGVTTEWSAKCSWNADTPGRVPAGARISAGKSGRVDRLLPKAAVSVVKRSPVSCIPSPESPAKRMITADRFLTGLVAVVFVIGTSPGSVLGCALDHSPSDRHQPRSPDVSGGAGRQPAPADATAQDVTIPARTFPRLIRFGPANRPAGSPAWAIRVAVGARTYAHLVPTRPLDAPADEPTRSDGQKLIELILGSEDWIHRQVERVDIQPTGDTIHNISMDLTVPVDLALAGSRGAVLVPVTLLQKGPLSCFSV